jgi:hypothetical protein
LQSSLKEIDSPGLSASHFTPGREQPTSQADFTNVFFLVFRFVGRGMNFNPADTPRNFLKRVTSLRQNQHSEHRGGPLHRPCWHAFPSSIAWPHLDLAVDRSRCRSSPLRWPIVSPPDLAADGQLAI